jgi:hypothetical protein
MRKRRRSLERHQALNGGSGASAASAAWHDRRARVPSLARPGVLSHPERPETAAEVTAENTRRQDTPRLLCSRTPRLNGPNRPHEGSLLNRSIVGPRGGLRRRAGRRCPKGLGPTRDAVIGTAVQRLELSRKHAAAAHSLAECSRRVRARSGVTCRAHAFEPAHPRQDGRFALDRAASRLSDTEATRSRPRVSGRPVGRLTSCSARCSAGRTRSYCSSLADEFRSQHQHGDRQPTDHAQHFVDVRASVL